MRPAASIPIPSIPVPSAPALALLAAALLAGPACTDFATPSELAKTTILAVVADPPLTPPGKQSHLELIVVDGSGRVAAPETSWQLVETVPGVQPMGTLAANPDGTATYTAPAMAPAASQSAPPIDSIQVRVAATPKPLTAIKGVAVIDVPSANPVLRSITADGADAATGITLAAGTKRLLSVEISPPASADATYAWYTTRGDIDDYQSAQCTLNAPADADTGWVFVVVRDGKGGVVWHAAPLTVQ